MAPHLNPVTVFLLVIFIVSPAHCANVLISAMYGEGSHFLFGAAVGESLAKRGHNVTFLISNAYQHRASDPRFSNMAFEIFEHPIPPDEVRDLFYNINTLAFLEGNQQFLELINTMAKRMVDDCEGVVSDRDLMERLEQNEVIIFDVTWPCARYMKAVFEEQLESSRKRTVVGLIPTSPWVGFLQFVGASVNYAYQPEIMTGYSNRMSFGQRVMNVFQSFLLPFIGDHTSLPLYQMMGERLGLDPKIHPIYDMVDIDLFLLNIDFSSDFPFPLPPNIQTVGGMTAKPGESLDLELEEFVQGSGDHGVVVFTLGTYLASLTTIRPDLVTMFAEAFRKIPQRVIWQLTELPDWELPSNVMAMPWLPQNDLLGHPKTKALMYTGGNNGFQEASYHGVPVVVIPLQGDQYDVAARIEARGMGRKIDKSKLNADLIFETLVEVINNPSYTEVARKVSAINKDQPMRAADKAAFWIEHVIKFGGSYMRSPAHELNFFQYHLLDVIVFLTAVAILLLLVLFYILRCCLITMSSYVWRGSSAKSKTE